MFDLHLDTAPAAWTSRGSRSSRRPRYSTSSPLIETPIKSSRWWLYARVPLPMPVQQYFYDVRYKLSTYIGTHSSSLLPCEHGMHESAALNSDRYLPSGESSPPQCWLSGLQVLLALRLASPAGLTSCKPFSWCLLVCPTHDYPSGWCSVGFGTCSLLRRGHTNHIHLIGQLFLTHEEACYGTVMDCVYYFIMTLYISHPKKLTFEMKPNLFSDEHFRGLYR